MILDFDHADTPAPERADVCILGAGALGVLLAIELTRGGKTVVLLEGGGAEQEERSQEIYRSELDGQRHRGIHEGRFRTYGGTTTRWGGQILELQPIDFEKRDWVPGSGWPFPKTELTGYYERALRFVGLRRAERDDEAVWQTLGLDRKELGIARQMLGPEFEMMYSRWLPERNLTVVHARELRESRKLQLYLHASAVGFRMSEAGNAIEAVKIRGFSGRTAEVRAGSFVLCLGGIESTRLLLQPPEQGSLPWQANGLLGRHFQDHIGMHEIPLRHLVTPEAWRYFGYVTSDGFRYHNKIWLTPAQQQRLKTLNVAGTLGPQEKEVPGRDEALQRLRTLVRQRQRPGMGEALRLLPTAGAIAANRLNTHYRGEAPAWKRVVMTVHSEQLPLSASRISLAEERDELGLLRSRLHWEIAGEELYTIRSYVRVADEVFRRTGFAQLEVPAGFYEDDASLRQRCADSYHHMGGTRMSVHPAEGIVDPDLRLHGVANGYVCSASVFPSSGYSNPTHTVLALGMRLADRLAGTQRAVEVQDARSQELTAAANLRQIALPGSGARTSQLGFGCAYLLGPGLDATTSRRLLDAAWDAGIRHFDVARLYGMGRTEALVGEFLAKHPEATVTTKFGVVPPSELQRWQMRAERLAPALGKVLPKRHEKAVFRAADAKAALETSLRALRRDRVELFLLHEAEAGDLLHDDLLAFLETKRSQGIIGEFGFGGEFAKVPALLAERPAYVPVLQFEHSVLGPQVETSGHWCAFYRTFAPAARVVSRMLEAERETVRSWSEAVGMDLSEPEIVSRLLLRASLDQWPGSLQLFSTSSEDNIFRNIATATDASLQQPAVRLLELLRRRPDLGRNLYGTESPR